MNDSIASERKITRRGLLRAGAHLSMGAGVVAAGSFGWGHFVETDWVEVENVELKLPRLSPAFDGFRLAQISDIHIESGDMRDRLPSICELVNAQKADAIVITGDYVTNVGNWQEDMLVRGLKLLKAPQGVFGVLGNHDQWGTPDDPQLGIKMVRRTLIRSGVQELPNQHITWRRGREVLHLCGLDDWLTLGMDVAALMAKLPSEGAAIVLQHEPDVADLVAPMGRFDLMLAGHSHGGQVALPIFGPIHVPFGAQKYPRGLYHLDGMKLYTNRGLGTIELPIRFCSRPEITVFTLRSL